MKNVKKNEPSEKLTMPNPALFIVRALEIQWEVRGVIGR